MNTSPGTVLPVTLVAVSVAILLLAAAAWSMPQGGARGHDPQRMFEYLATRLDLTAEQRTAVQPLLDSLATATATDASRLHTLRETLRGQRADFDAAAARATADEIGQITSGMAYRMASTQAQIYQQLNDAQRAKLDELEKKREARREQWHERWHAPLQ